MKISFYKYILLFLFLYSCHTIDELHGIDNLKIQSESFKVNTTNSNDVLNLIGPPQSIGLKNENIWYYGTGTIKSLDSIKAYINGSVVASSGIGSATFSLSNYTLYAGYNTEEYYYGDIAIVQLYNRALIATEILQNYNAQKGRFGL